MPISYTEDTLVEQPAIALLGELGWETYHAYDEFAQAGGSPLGRETKAEVVLTARLRPALERLNPGAPAEAVGQAVEEITRDRSRMSLVAANREVYGLIKDGVRVRVPDSAAVGEQVALIRVIAAKIRALSPLVDISEVMGQVEELLDRFIAPQGYVIGEKPGSYDTEPLVDLSAIDLEKLEAGFEHSRKHTEVERIRSRDAPTGRLYAGSFLALKGCKTRPTRAGRGAVRDVAEAETACAGKR